MLYYEVTSVRIRIETVTNSIEAASEAAAKKEGNRLAQLGGGKVECVVCNIPDCPTTVRQIAVPAR